MKKLIAKFIIISIATLIVAWTFDYFSNKAKAVDIPISISINDQHPWSQSFNWDNFLPGDSKKINLVIKNTGTDPAKIWKKIRNLTIEENGITEPEGVWYDEHGIDRSVGKNDMDSAIVYGLKVGSNFIINPEANIYLNEVKNAYMYLEQLAPGAEMTVEEGYYLKYDAGNWMQSDKMSFDMEILALSLDAPDPVNN